MKLRAQYIGIGVTAVAIFISVGVHTGFAQETTTTSENRVHTVQTSGRPVATNPPIGGFNPFDWRSYRLPSEEERNRPADGVLVMTSDRERIVTEPSNFKNSASNDDNLGEVIKTTHVQKFAGGGMVASVNQAGVFGGGMSDILLLLFVLMLIVAVLLSRIIFKKRKSMIRQDYHTQQVPVALYARSRRGISRSRAPRAPRAPSYRYAPPVQNFGPPVYQARY